MILIIVIIALCAILIITGICCCYKKCNCNCLKTNDDESVATIIKVKTQSIDVNGHARIKATKVDTDHRDHDVQIVYQERVVTKVQSKQQTKTKTETLPVGSQKKEEHGEPEPLQDDVRMIPKRVHKHTMNGDSNDVGIVLWNEQTVLNWIRGLLLNDGLDGHEVVDPFLQEFKTHHITGPMLLRLGNNRAMIDELKNQFTKKNQAFGIWMVLKNEIVDIVNKEKQIQLNAVQPGSSYQ